MAPSGLTVKEEMLYQQYEFLRLHMWTLCVAMECCIHETQYQFDVKKRFMHIALLKEGGKLAKKIRCQLRLV
jgi:hypothetical protein